MVLNLAACLQDQYQLHFAKNGAVGIEKAIAIIPDIIISDVMMPQKDGFEVCQTLKTNTATSHIPIILLTAKAAVEDKLRGLEFGADAYLAKPFNPKELKIRLAKLIEVRQRLQAKYSEGVLIENPIPKTEDTFLKKVQAAILDNLNAAHFGPNELGQAIGVSRSQLHRKLKALTDNSTSNYINKIRLQEGKKLLYNLDLNISEIAYRVGFSTPQYFSTNFSKIFHCTPTEYRNRLIIK